ncbi:23S rRNA (guanosine(2251)-2'-O)-methyltransferase RlmB [Phenylobacterium sp.]|uniref:23S rRNA (guanosine(2251)-2'-O)-methyltransferase RlmB n=1 Tax=Phenylobacterium sp. TaxID=1871053 RepID=UPI0035B4E3D0
MASHPERNDARKGKKRPPQQRFQRRPDTASDDWIWGWHAVEAALANPARGAPLRLLATTERARQIEQRFGRLPALETADNQLIAQNLPQGAVHQGVALRSPPPEPADLADFEPRPGAVLLMLDQVTDPQNVGAILRSAAAFGAAGVILQDRHAPRFTGALAKAAAGAVERVPVARVVNLSRALEELSDLGWRAVGLTGHTETDLHAALDGAPTVLVLGSEGEGLRRLVAEHCDELARIPMPGGFESLNVSAAAAVALYEASRPRT